MNITSLDALPAAFGNSTEMLQELVQSVVREELQRQRLGQNAPMLSSLADVICKEVQQAVQEAHTQKPHPNAYTEAPLTHQPNLSYANILL